MKRSRKDTPITASNGSSDSGSRCTPQLPRGTQTSNKSPRRSSGNVRGCTDAASAPACSARPDDPVGATEAFEPSQPPSARKKAGYLGTLLRDRYLIEKELGRGGFGVVYLARDQQLLAKPVVIKILTQDFTADPWTLKKFRQETEAMARIDHPAVIGALDTGDTDDGKPFIAMQFVEGVTLRGEINQGVMDLARVASITRQIGQGLQAAHDKGIWHRDLKPENAMLQKLGDGEEYVKLIDFGIAVIQNSQFSPKDSQTTRVAGSFAYMSPEQFQGKPGAQSDIWSFGIIVYEMLTGVKPFPADSLFDLMLQHQRGVAARPRHLRPDLPEAAEQALLKALAVSTEVRYQRPKEFGDAFARAISGGDSGSFPSRDAAPAAPARVSEDRVEIANVLSLDIAGYSLLPLDRQWQYLSELSQVVRDTPTFQAAKRAGELVHQPAANGMALAFFGGPATSVDCAVQVAKALQSRPHLKVRTGIHTGPVYRVTDNDNLSSAVGAIDTAQRVMGSGDAGHILLSGTMADVLGQLGGWCDTLKDLGEHADQSGVKLRLFNLCTLGAGNPNLPAAIASPAAAALPSSPRPRAISRLGLLIGGAAGVVLSIVGYFLTHQS